MNFLSFGQNRVSEESFHPLQDLSGRTNPDINNNDNTVAAFASWFATGHLQRARYKDFSSMDWIFERYKSRGRKHVMKLHSRTFLGKLNMAFDTSQTWLVLLIVGIVVGTVSSIISINAQWMIDLKDGYCSTGFYLNQRFCCWKNEDFCADWVTWSEVLGVKWSIGEGVIQFLVYIFDAIVFSAIATFLVTFYAPYAAGQGISELKTIISGFIMSEFLSFKTFLIKSVGIVFSVASGLNVGKETALVHIAACSADIFGKFFPKIKQDEAQKRQILSAASAAGISVAFGAPIAGVLFSLEAISYYFPLATMWKSFFCATVAAVTLKYFDPFRNGKLVPFQNVYERTWYSFELFFFIFIGIVGGIVGALIVKINAICVKYRQKSYINKYARGEVVFVAAVTAMVCYTNIFARADAVTLVSNLFTECRDKDKSGLCDTTKDAMNISSLLIAFVLRIVFTSVSCGLAVPTGIFLPSMAIGASFGRALGMTIEHMHSQCQVDVKCVTPAVYALVGAAAVLSGTTRLSVSVVVIMFELTGALVYVLPLMLAVTASTWVSKLLNSNGIFESMIRIHEYPYLEKERDYKMSGLARGIMTPAHDLMFINASDQTLSSLQSLVFTSPTDQQQDRTSTTRSRNRNFSEPGPRNLHSQYQGFPVVSSIDSMLTLGYISTNDLKLGLETALNNSLNDGFSLNTKCYFGSTSEGSSSIDENLSSQGERPSTETNFIDYSQPSTSVIAFGDTSEYLEFDEPGSVYIDLRPYMDHSPVTVFPDTPIDLVIDIFRQLGIRYVLVAKNRVLYGIITKKDVLKIVNKSDISPAQPFLRYLFPSIF
ncbi:hypothetical protein BB559_005948 [Furculomyces boomerangus]|uniref:Chloride channel protein n=1 Tax=Furculomyces boomerangus TaxID=61424 RepID=A0A2T9Y5T5_9FUNG|nr:hypothetical protein BB559_005948 [Furculomyces boomerangus]